MNCSLTLDYGDTSVDNMSSHPGADILGKYHQLI